MSVWANLRGLLGGARPYALVWREHTAQGTVMKGEPVTEKSDAAAISSVRAKFMHVEPHWTFWALFRPDDTMVTAEQGPGIAKWFGDFAHIGNDSHVRHTLESVRRHRKPVSRPLHKVRLKSRMPEPESEPE
jgi:hypothetical protein